MADTSEGSTALVKSQSTSLLLRSAWRSYQEWPVGYRVVLPFTLALVLLSAAWTLLNNQEYGLAVLSAVLFMAMGVVAVCGWRIRRLFKTIFIVGILVIGVFSLAKFWKDKGDKPLSTLLLRPPPPPALAIPQPTLSPSSSPIEQVRNELRAESSKPLRDVAFHVKLNRPYSIQELGHYRVIYEIFNNDRLDFYLACQDLYQVNTYSDPVQKQFGYRCTARYQESGKRFTAVPLYTSPRKYSSVLSGSPVVNELEWKIDLYNQIPSYRTLEDFNRKYLYIFVTAPLVEKIDEVTFEVNNWELISVKSGGLKFIADHPIAPWFLPLSPTEKKIEWRGVYLKEDAEIARQLAKIGKQDYVMVFPLDFMLIHPRKLSDPNVSSVYP